MQIDGREKLRRGNKWLQYVFLNIKETFLYTCRMIQQSTISPLMYQGLGASWLRSLSFRIKSCFSA